MIEIQKAKINTDDTMSIKYREIYASKDDEDDDGDQIQHGETAFSWPAHEDLKESFTAFLPHFIRMGEFPDSEKEKFTVTGFVITGEPNKQCIHLMGYKRVPSGKINMTLPKHHFGNQMDLFDGEDVGVQLWNIFQTAEQQVKEYLKGKRSEGASVAVGEQQEEVEED